MNHHQYPGLYIVFEGIDAVGKSTQISLLHHYIKQSGYPVILLKEPGDSEAAKKISLIRQKKLVCSIQEELEFFVEDRKENQLRHVIPSLKSGKVVLQDRNFLSTLAYQGGKEISYNDILKIHDFVILPDLFIILEAPLEAILQRLKQERAVQDHFEQQERLERVWGFYHQYQQDNVYKISTVEGIEDCHSQIKALVGNKLEQIQKKLG